MVRKKWQRVAVAIAGVSLVGATAAACVGQPDSRGCTNWRVNGKIVRTC